MSFGRSGNRASDKDTIGGETARIGAVRWSATEERDGVVQIDPEPNYDHKLVERVVSFLQTKDPRLFPFTRHFDEARHRAFQRDLREGLAEITDSGSARKTSAAGFIMSDERLREIVYEWAAAQGRWPRGAEPTNRVSALGALGPDDPDLVPSR